MSTQRFPTMATDPPRSPQSDYSLPADIATAVQAIHGDSEHGASWLARAAARALVQAGEPRADIPSEAWESVMQAAARALVVARPSMAAVANTAARVWSAGLTADSQAMEERRQRVLAMATRLATQDEQVRQALVSYATTFVTGVVYTISRSSTIEDLLRALGLRRTVERVIVPESRPGGEGVALARALASNGLPVTVVADAACGVFIGEATCVLLGADSLRADGSVVNKVGSYPLALAAHAAGRPVYVLCETLKIAAPDFPLTLEEKDPGDLLPDQETEAIPQLNARNPYFDVTPAALITSYITEEGTLDRDAIMRQASMAGVALDQLEAG